MTNEDILQYEIGTFNVKSGTLSDNEIVPVKEKFKIGFLYFGSLLAQIVLIYTLFYWDHKPMDDIASIVGMKNADSVITKKTKCMAKFKEIGKMLIENDEFPEEDILWIVMFLVSSKLQFNAVASFRRLCTLPC